MFLISQHMIKYNRQDYYTKHINPLTTYHLFIVDFVLFAIFVGRCWFRIFDGLQLVAF